MRRGGRQTEHLSGCVRQYVQSVLPPRLCSDLCVKMASTRTKEKLDPVQQVVAKANKIATNKGRYEYEELLGEGGFGKVLKAKDTRSGEFVAVKHIEAKKTLKQLLLLKTPTSAQQGRKEAALLTELEHDNVIAILDSFEFTKPMGKTVRLAIVMEYCIENLHNHLNVNFVGIQKRLDKMHRLQWYQQLAGGLAYIHEKNVIHRDLKPLNILVSTKGTLKIADVGLAKVIYESEEFQGTFEKYLTENHAGTPLFVPPETFTPGCGMSRYESDVFSLGMVMYLMCELPHELCPFAHWMPLGELMVRYPTVATLPPTSLLDAKFTFGTIEEKVVFDKMLQYRYDDRPRADKVVQMLISVKETWERQKREAEKRERERIQREKRENERLEAEARRREDERRRLAERSWLQRAADYFWSLF